MGFGKNEETAEADSPHHIKIKTIIAISAQILRIIVATNPLAHFQNTHSKIKKV